jgi:cytochrome c
VYFVAERCLSRRHQQYGSFSVTLRFGGVGSRHRETSGRCPHFSIFSGESQNQSREEGSSRKGSSHMTKRGSIAIVALMASASTALAGDIAAGERSFKKCMPCHMIGETAKNMIGPIQNGLKGRKSGSVPGFSYSDANKNSGIVWDEATFKEYIKDPKAKIPGTKMVFPGIKDEKEADDLWSFLAQFGPDGKKK